MISFKSSPPYFPGPFRIQKGTLNVTKLKQIPRLFISNKISQCSVSFISLFYINSKLRPQITSYSWFIVSNKKLLSCYWFPIRAFPPCWLLRGLVCLELPDQPTCAFPSSLALFYFYSSSSAYPVPPVPRWNRPRRLRSCSFLASRQLSLLYSIQFVRQNLKICVIYFERKPSWELNIDHSVSLGKKKLQKVTEDEEGRALRKGLNRIN